MHKGVVLFLQHMTSNVIMLTKSNKLLLIRSENDEMVSSCEEN